jgi:hypothetical protein
MADNNLFKLKIITPDRMFYEGEVSMVEFNTTEGEIGVLKKHVPTTVIISPGILTITEADGTKEAALHAGFAEILRTAQEDLRFVPTGKAITSFCGLRAVGSTGDFILTSPKKGFINAAGIESPGLSASPAIAEYIAEMLKNQGLILTEKTDYNPNRLSMHAFREMSIEEKTR